MYVCVVLQAQVDEAIRKQRLKAMGLLPEGETPTSPGVLVEVNTKSSIPATNTAASASTGMSERRYIHIHHEHIIT